MCAVGREPCAGAGSQSAWDQCQHVREPEGGCPAKADLGVAGDGRGGSALQLRGPLCLSTAGQTHRGQRSRAVPCTRMALPWTAEDPLMKISIESGGLFPGSMHTDPSLQLYCFAGSFGHQWSGRGTVGGSPCGLLFQQVGFPSGGCPDFLWPPAMTCSV